MARTQNVQGLPKAPGLAEHWFSLFGTKDGRHAPAVTLIQETHASADDVRDLEARYRGRWGFNKLRGQLSYWSAHNENKGGVAILLNPYLVNHATPAMQDRWSPHFIAVLIDVQGHSVMVINIYAPTDKPEREALFNALAEADQHEGPILIGGDFNCSIHPDLDRTYQKTAASHRSPALNGWLRKWHLTDALAPFFPDDTADRDEMARFHAEQHTYRYHIGKIPASSRLDRWYVSPALQQWVHSVNACDLGGSSDHASVVLRLIDPARRVAVKPKRRVYPPKPCAESATDALIRTRIELVAVEFDRLNKEEAPPKAFHDAWDAFKSTLVREIRVCSRTAVSQVNRSYKVKLARLRRRLRRPGLTLEEIRAGEAALQATALHWQRLKRQRKLWQLTDDGPEAMRAFYDRAAQQRTSSLIFKLKATDGEPSRAPTDLANRMADGWKSTFTQPKRRLCQSEVSLLHGEPLAGSCAEPLDGPISIAEVERSVRRCKRTKSAGPDDLPNAWYRAYSHELCPLLTTLFNQSFANGTVPTSFQDATIACVPKAGHSEDPLGYRPIALLNTDYKIFMRVLSFRLKPLLDDLIAPSQAGFVPGRSIHEVIDVYSSAQRIATEQGLDAVAVLLDIRKAYDSLDRQFLNECLRRRGLPARFRRAVDATHTDTVCRFRVNGSLSSPVQITRGIRQGCPLAPLLFVISMDPLYRTLAADPALQSPLGEMYPEFPPCCGYADDTAIYVASEEKMACASSHLDRFERLSGLGINTSKTVAIRLNINAGPLSCACDFVTLDNDEPCRYLGIQVGRQAHDNVSWTLTLNQIRRRLALAGEKTHTVRQRATLVRAIALPKILYVARHQWPSKQWIHQLSSSINNFVWAGRFKQHLDADDRAQHWMTAALAGLPVGACGVNIPNLRLELQTLAAHTLARWCYDPSGLRQLTARTLAQRGMKVQPTLFRTRKGASPGLGNDLWDTGRKALEWIYSDCIDFPTAILIQDGIQALRTRTDWRWWRGTYERDYSDFFRTGGQEITRLRQSPHGRLAADWISSIGISDKTSPIIWHDGSQLTSKHLAPLGAGTTIADYVSWQWVGPHTLRFRPKVGFPLSNEASAVFRGLCDALVVNHPDMTCCPDEPDTVRTYNVPASSDIGWKWTPQGGLCKTLKGIPDSSVPVSTQFQLQRQPALRIDSMTVTPQFECTPRLTRLVRAWRGHKPWKPDRRHYRRSLGSTARNAGLDGRVKREERWKTAHDQIANELASVPWHEFVKAPGLTASDHQLWLKVRHHQLNAWPTPTQERGCPRRLCDLQTTATTSHVLWNCPRARHHWSRVTDFWGVQDRGDSSLITGIFSRSPPTSIHDWRRLIPQRDSAVSDRLEYWTRRLWLLLITCGVSRLWRSCIQALQQHDPTTHDSDAHATIQMWTTRVRSILCGVSAESETAGINTHQLDATILRHFLTRLTSGTPPPPLPAQTTGYVLFFDGGSRGNPGPGGSGSVIVRLGSPPTIAWAAAMSYANVTTTNNYAEYQGLGVGLRAAEEFRFLPLAVVGDSKMIIQQMQQRRRPRARRLLPLYENARSTADAIDVRSWCHHYRSHNKMADKAANQAMDQCSSYQATAEHARPEMISLQVWLANDINHWLERGPHRPPVDGTDRPDHRPVMLVHAST